MNSETLGGGRRLQPKSWQVTPMTQKPGERPRARRSGFLLTASADAGDAFPVESQSEKSSSSLESSPSATSSTPQSIGKVTDVATPHLKATGQVLASDAETTYPAPGPRSGLWRSEPEACDSASRRRELNRSDDLLARGSGMLRSKSGALRSKVPKRPDHNFGTRFAALQAVTATLQHPS